MPNIVGQWRPESDSQEIRKSLAAQINAIRASATNYDEYKHVSAGYGIGLIDHGIFENGRQPVYSEDRNFVLVLDGEISNCDELLRRHRDDLPKHSYATPELCLELIVRKGPEIVSEFAGSFVIAVFDTACNELTLISDRLGFRPLFLVDRGQTFIFATELKGLVAADSRTPTIDSLGLLELFCYNSHAFGRTWVNGYLRLAPATIMRIGTEYRESYRYWTYEYAESAERLDQHSYVIGYAKLIDRAVERAMRGKKRIGIFVSGGYDSRAIAAAIRSQHLPIPAFTFGDVDSRDVLYGREVAKRLHLEHTTITRTGPYLYPNAAAIAWRTEGMLPFANTTSIQYHELFRQHMDIILAGFLGEFSGSHVWPGLLLARSRKATIETVYERFVGSRLPHVSLVFDHEFLKKHLIELRSALEESFSIIDNDHPINVADSWNFRFLHPQETHHAPSIDRHLFESRSPLTDKDLVDFLLNIPPIDRLEQRVYKKVIAYSYPSVRNVPCTNSGKPIDPNFAREYLRMVADFTSRKVMGPVRKLTGKHQSERDFRNLANDIRAEPELISELLEPMLCSDIYPSSIFNIGGIRSIAKKHYEGTTNFDMLLSNLIGWGLAHKQILQADYSDVPEGLRGG